MKNPLRILFALVLCLFICQTNVEGQVFKNALNKVKGAVGSVTSKVTGGKVGSGGVSSSGPAKPVAPEVKNSVAEVRALTGVTEEATLAKLKSMGFVETENIVGMGGKCYFSKAKGYYLNISFGTRGKDLYARQITKTTIIKNPNLATVKTTFLGLGKQCADLKTKYGSGEIRGISGPKLNQKIKNAEEFPAAFSSYISSKESGLASENYSENDYNYVISFTYTQGVPAAKLAASTQISIMVCDMTLESQEG